VHEAAQLQRDLRRAEIEPYAWIINNSLCPLNVTDPLLVERQKQEARYIHEVVNGQASRTALIAWQLEPPVGPEALKRAIQARG
jgi:arsenite-transporting ATPase